MFNTLIHPHLQSSSSTNPMVIGCKGGTLLGSSVSFSSPQMMMGGETFTITCYTCGMPSSKEWAQRVHTRPNTKGLPFFPFLNEFKSQTSTGGTHITREDTSTFLCAFCYASLESQWNSFDKGHVTQKDRHYCLNNFICAVCGVETYRKRVRALPFQEFPFLTKERPHGSLTLGTHPLAIVCLDCSETLWAQSAEYDRWGLPVQKRHFNWMSRPPPPENSMEATVARLPSGETQLPRCPPTEPVVVPRRKNSFHSLIPKSVTDFSLQQNSSQPLTNLRPLRSNLVEPTSGKRSSEMFGRESRSPIGSNSRSSLSVSNRHHSDSHHLHHSNGLQIQGVSNGGVPIVTVAPMSSRTTSGMGSSTFEHESKNHTIGNVLKRESLKNPLIQNGELFSASNGFHLPPHAPSSIYLGLGTGYGNFGVWNGGAGSTPSTTSHLDPYSSYKRTLIEPIGGTTNQHAIPPPPLLHSRPDQNQLSWIPPTAIANPDHTRYESFITNRRSYKAAVESYFSHPHPHPLLQSNEATSRQNEIDSTLIRHSVSPNPSPKLLSGTTSNFTSSKFQNDHFAQNMLGQYSTYSSSLVNNHLSFDSGRKRPGGSLSPSTMIPHKISSSTKSSDFVTIPRVTRHLNPSKGIERNRDYILSVSAIVAETESEKPILTRPQHRSGLDIEAVDLTNNRISIKPVINPPPNHITIDHSLDKRKDLVVKSGVSFGQQLESRKPPSNFLIANICAENFSSPNYVKPEDKTTELEAINGKSRNSVIVSVRSPIPIATITSSTLNVPHKLTSLNHKSGNSCVFTQNRAPSAPPNINNVNGIVSPIPQIIVTSPPVAEVKPREVVAIVKEAEKPPPTIVDTTIEDDERELIIDEGRLIMSEEKVEPEPAEVLPSIPFDKKDVNPTDNRKMSEEEIVAKSTAEFQLLMQQRAQQENEQKEAQRQFLKHVQLITPRENDEIEIKMLTSRLKQNTLPPLKFRADSPKDQDDLGQMTETVEKHILLTAFEDPSLKKSINNPKLLDFMKNMDMKPSTRLEKYEREEKWRIILAERMLRSKRNVSLCGPKKPWESTTHISKHLLPIEGNQLRKRRHSIPPVFERRAPLMRALSLNLPPDPPGRIPTTNSTDLLATVESKSNTDLEVSNEMAQASPRPYNRMGISDENLQKILSVTQPIRQPVISYPKYIPSYAATLATQKIIATHESIIKRNENENSTINSSEMVPITIPTTNPRTTPLTASNHQENDQGNYENGSQVVTIDKIIQRSNTSWAETKEEIERLVRMKCDTKTERRFPSVSELKRLRRSIHTQQAEMKMMVKWLKELSSTTSSSAFPTD